jgi:NAD(P)-dependent dehydrogenase (short-subunit alcohol dehydrogenase family)
MGRVGRANEITRVMAYLASDDASYPTGQDFALDGGLTFRAERSGFTNHIRRLQRDLGSR